LKNFEAFTKAQRRAAERLGVKIPAEWDDYSADVWSMGWWDLTEFQRRAARALGFVEANWAFRSPAAVENGTGMGKAWSELTEVEREAAAQLCIRGEDAWEKASPDGRQQVLRSLWARAWEELSEEEVEAARTLGLQDADDWDDATWKSGDGFGRAWAELSRKEQRAAKKLGLTGPGLWAKVSADKLDNFWGVTPWSSLSPGQQSAAGRLGYDRASWSAA
jgi:predicted Fe-S protein YdhL (DUF1289 family)